MNYSIIRVLLSIIGLSPIRNTNDFDLKWDIANAIVETTNEPQQQDTLVLIAYYESNFSNRVATCTKKGDKGKSLGLFQIQPITKYDAKYACGTPAEQVKLAYSYMVRSYEACPGNVGADLLAMYVSGTCKRGLIQAKNRWAQ